MVACLHYGGAMENNFPAGETGGHGGGIEDGGGARERATQDEKQG